MSKSVQEGCSESDSNWLTSDQSNLEVATRLKAVAESGKTTELYDELEEIHPDGPALIGR